MRRRAAAQIRAAALRAGRVGASLALQHRARPRPDHVFYSAFTGRYADNPRGIFEELVRRRPGGAHTWMAAPPLDAFPPGVVRVKPYGWRSLDALGRAGLVVSNTQMPNSFRKRGGATYLQTWHGTPLKRIGHDNPRWLADPGGWRRFRRDVAKWDYLVSQNPFSTEVFRRAFRFDGEILEMGYPRNDALNAPDREDVRRRARAELGIAEDATAVLYAPTWRDTLVDEHGKLGFSLALDVDALGRALGDDLVVLLRLHYLIASALADAHGARVKNVSDVADIRELYLAADVLITDYSSAMFDFAVTGKPMVFFTYDLAEYRDQTRGFYFELEETAPGPLCESSDEVASALADPAALARSYADRYARFRQRFCPHDDGHAARRILDRVL
jgi:CDP-glycerol glycerophosphotransferase